MLSNCDSQNTGELITNSIYYTQFQTKTKSVVSSDQVQIKSILQYSSLWSHKLLLIVQYPCIHGLITSS